MTTEFDMIMLNLIVSIAVVPKDCILIHVCTTLSLAKPPEGEETVGISSFIGKLTGSNFSSWHA